MQGALLNFAVIGLLFAMSLMLQQGRGLSAIVSGLLFLPLTGLISIGGIYAAKLAHRIGRRAASGNGQAIMAAALLAVAWASTSSPLWPLVLALVPVGFSVGLLVSTMTAQSIASAATGVALLLTGLTRPATVAAPAGSLNAQAPSATSAQDTPGSLRERD